MTRMFLIILLFPFFSYSQTGYIKINGYFDQSVVEKIKKESKEHQRSLVYQPFSDSLFSSVLVIQGKGSSSYWIIKNDSILAKGVLKVNNLFCYKFYLKTGATHKENKLKFVPPLIGGKETELVIYEDPLRKFYFEYGKNVTGYTPDADLETYRKEWLNLLRSEIYSILEEKEK